MGKNLNKHFLEDAIISGNLYILAQISFKVMERFDVGDTGAESYVTEISQKFTWKGLWKPEWICKFRYCLVLAIEYFGKLLGVSVESSEIEGRRKFSEMPSLIWHCYNLSMFIHLTEV